MPRISLLLLTVALACAKDSGIESGLPADEPADQLTPPQQTDLCDAIADYADARLTQADFAGFFCTTESLGAGDGTDIPSLIAACKQARDACIASGMTETINFECREAPDFAACGVTVGQLEACLEDAIDLFDSLAADYTCDILDPAKAMALQDKYGDQIDDPFPPSCDPVVANCPAFFGDGGDAPPPMATAWAPPALR